MSSSALDLRGSQISELKQEGDQLTLSLSPAYLLKSEGIAGVDASTRWTVNAQLVLREVEVEGELPEVPATIESARLRLNQHTYVDLVTMPIETPGYIRLELTTEGAGARLAVDAQYIRYFPLDQEKYVEHVES